MSCERLKKERSTRQNSVQSRSVELQCAILRGQFHQFLERTIVSYAILYYPQIQIFEEDTEASLCERLLRACCTYWLPSVLFHGSCFALTLCAGYLADHEHTSRCSTMQAKLLPVRKSHCSKSRCHLPQAFFPNGLLQVACCACNTYEAEGQPGTGLYFTRKQRRCETIK